LFFINTTRNFPVSRIITMPELAEVSGLVERLKPALLDKEITDATAEFHKNVYADGLDAERLADFLKGKTVSNIERWGKSFWIEFKGSEEVFLLVSSGSFNVCFRA